MAKKSKATKKSPVEKVEPKVEEKLPVFSPPPKPEPKYTLQAFLSVKPHKSPADCAGKRQYLIGKGFAANGQHAFSDLEDALKTY